MVETVNATTNGMTVIETFNLKKAHAQRVLALSDLVFQPILEQIDEKCRVATNDTPDLAALKQQVHKVYQGLTINLLDQYFTGSGTLVLPKEAPKFAAAVAVPTLNASRHASAPTNPLPVPPTAILQRPKPQAVAVQPTIPNNWAEVVSKSARKRASRAAVKANSNVTPTVQTRQNQQQRAQPASTKPKESRPVSRDDNRILVQLADKNPSKNSDSFALGRQLRAINDTFTKHFARLDATKTGFAITPNSEDGRAAMLTHSEELCKFFGKDTIIKAAVAQDSYMVGPIATYMPGKDNILYEVTAEDIALAFNDSFNIEPTFVNRIPKDKESYYIVSIKANGANVTKKMRLGAYRVLVRYMRPRSTFTTQCGKCFGFDHLEKTCSRAKRCACCGSTDHTREAHPRCTVVDHECPSKCMNCNGPHAADDDKCPLRPVMGQEPLSFNAKASLRERQANLYLKSRTTFCTVPLAQAKTGVAPENANGARKRAREGDAVMADAAVETPSASTDVPMKELSAPTQTEL